MPGIDSIIERYKEAYLQAADRDIERALELVIRDLGKAKFNQSSGYMRYVSIPSYVPIVEPDYLDIPEPDGDA